MEFEIGSISDIAGILISVLALVVSVGVFFSEKKLTTNSVKPYLNMFCGFHADNVYVRVENNGMGTAIVSNVEFRNGKGQPLQPQPLSLAHYVYTRAEAEGSQCVERLGTFYDFVPTSAIRDRAITVDSSIFLMQYRSHDPQACDFVRECLEDIRISISYKNVFGDAVGTDCEKNCGEFFKNASTSSGENASGPVLDHHYDE